MQCRHSAYLHPMRRACLLPVLVILVVSSCYTPRYTYSPPATNVPVLDKKGDSKIGGYYSATGFRKGEKSAYNYGFDIQGAYAFGDHWALLAAQSDRYEKNGGDFDAALLDSAVIRYKRSLTEIGGGWYKNTWENRMQFQLFGGIGFGKFLMDDAGKNGAGQYYSRFHRVGVTRLFIQPAIVLKYSKYFTTSFATRFSSISYHNVETNYTAAEQDSFLLNKLTESPKTFWEPAIINSFTFKKIPRLRLEIQAGFASLVSRKFVDYRSVNLSAGAILELRGKRR